MFFSNTSNLTRICFPFKGISCLLMDPYCRFDGGHFLSQILKGKSIMFVGDSLSLNQWQSLTCMLHVALPQANYSLVRTGELSTFTFPVRPKSLIAPVSFLVSMLSYFCFVFCFFNWIMWELINWLPHLYHFINLENENTKRFKIFAYLLNPPHMEISFFANI